MGVSINDAMQKNHLSANQVYDSRVMDKATIRHILSGQSVNTKYYNMLFEWLEENYPEVYKEAMKGIIENLDRLEID